MTPPCIEVIGTNSDNNNSINGNAQVCPIGPKSAQTITDRGPNSTSSGGGGCARCAWVGGGAMGEFSVGRFDIVYLHFIRTSSIVITPSIRGRASSSRMRIIQYTTLWNTFDSFANGQFWMEIVCKFLTGKNRAFATTLVPPASQHCIPHLVCVDGGAEPRTIVDYFRRVNSFPVPQPKLQPHPATARVATRMGNRSSRHSAQPNLNSI